MSFLSLFFSLADGKTKGISNYEIDIYLEKRTERDRRERERVFSDKIGEIDQSEEDSALAAVVS